MKVLELMSCSLVRGGRLLFKDLSFSLNRYEVMLITGSNGSGKTSLLKMITHLLPPTKGKMQLLGKMSDEIDDEQLQQIFYLGHNNPLKLELTVWENVSLNAQIFDGIVVNNEQIMTALQAVGLLDFAHLKAKNLSAGQKRRVSLARLYLLDQRFSLIILDEPLTALDSRSCELLIIHLQSLVNQGATLVVTSHQKLQFAQMKTLLLDDYKE